MKEEQKNQIKTTIYSAIFNLIEIAIILGVGLLMEVKLVEIIILFVLFFMTRMTSYKPMHYKSPLKCMVGSTLIFISFFLLTKINLLVAIIMTVFEATMLTGKGDIQDGLLYRKENESKYIEMKDFIQKNKGSEELKGYESVLKNINKQYQERYKMNFYQIYQLKFYENKTFKQIIEETNLNDNKDVTKALDIISISFNTYRQTIK